MAWTFGAGQGNGGGLGGGTAGFGSGAGPFAGNFGSGGDNAGQIVFGDGSGFGGGGPSSGQQAGSPGGVAAAAAAPFGFVAGGGTQGGQSAVEKLPGFRMRVDSDDGMSDDERGSGTDGALGRGCSRRHDWLDYCRASMKKQKHGKKTKPFVLSFHKLQDCPGSSSKQPSEKKQAAAAAKT